jgi:hypothetical protein
MSKEAIEQIAAKTFPATYVNDGVLHDDNFYGMKRAAYISSYQTHCLPLIEELRDAIEFFKSQKEKEQNGYNNSKGIDEALAVYANCNMIWGLVISKLEPLISNDHESKNQSLIEEVKRLREGLTDAKLQIEYLHEKFGFTGSGNLVLTKIESVLSSTSKVDEAKSALSHVPEIKKNKI